MGSIDDLLLGTFTARMDDKGRVTLPAKRRGDFAGGVVLVKGQDRCLYVFTPDAFRTFAAGAINADVTDARARGYQRYMLANSIEQVPDGQGRIGIPARMREFAELDKDVVMTGIGERMEIWNADAWFSYESMQEPDYVNPERGTLHDDT